MGSSGKIANAVALGAHVVRVLALDRMARDGVAVRRYQERRLRTLVRYAYEHVPLYRRRFDAAGLGPDAIRTLDDLPRLPILTKADLRGAPLADLLPAHVRPEDCYLAQTSGSTGEPTRLYRDRTALFSLGAWTSPQNIARWTGRRATRLMTLLVRHEGSLEEALVRSLPRRLLRVHAGDALAPPAEHVRALNEVRPELLITYPSVLRNLAVQAEEAGGVVHQPQTIALSAEVFDTATRRLASQTFPASTVVNAYGATEAGLMALECAHHRGLHVVSTRAILEVLRDGRPAPPGEPGEVVVTDLTNFGTPIIRYAGLGDVAAWSPARCPCGRVFPLLAAIEGRRVDSFILPDGRLVHPYTLTLAMEDVSGIHRYQILQEEAGRVRVLLVGPSSDGAGTRAAVADALRAILGPEVQVVVDPVPDLAPPPGAPAPPTVRSLVRR